MDGDMKWVEKKNGDCYEGAIALSHDEDIISREMNCNSEQMKTGCSYSRAL